MKTCLAVAVGLLAATEGVPISMMDPVARLGAVGVLGFVVVWLVTRTIPAMSRDHKEALQELNETLQKVLLSK